MVYMNLSINLSTSDLDEAADILNRLRGLKVNASGEVYADPPRNKAKDPDPEIQQGAEEGETQRRRRRTKAEMEAERAAAAETPVEPRTLADQIKEVQSEEDSNADLLADMLGGAAEEPEPTYTADDVRKVMSAAIGKFEPSPVGKRIAKVTGGPIMIKDIPPEKYAAVIAEMEAMLAGN